MSIKGPRIKVMRDLIIDNNCSVIFVSFSSSTREMGHDIVVGDMPRSGYIA